MGRLALQDMLLQNVQRQEVLRWHLQHNHFPPHPTFMIAVAEAAIDACQAGEPEKRIALPEGVEHKRFGKDVPAAVIVESLHLREFLE